MREILAGHRPEYLEADLDAEIGRILERYERQGGDGNG
jgi:hypothetical protein